MKIDLTPEEVLVYDPIRRPVAHPYTDAFPTLAEPLCYSLPEIFGEKLRALAERCLGVPWFKHYRPEQIDQYVAAFRKVACQARRLL